MKPTLRLLIASTIALIALCTVAAAPPARTVRPAPIVLPLEVMGEDGTIKTITLTLPRPAAMLTLQMHGLENEQEGSVRVNDAPWVPLTNHTCFVAGLGRSFGGIGGGFATLRLSVPMRAPAGACRLQFRFNHTDGVNSGFRVLHFNFLDKSSRALLPSTQFRAYDPAKEKPLLPAAADINAGRKLWHSAALRESPMVHTNLKVTCADCHSEDGRDLKYFGYTNNSIYQRCLFHGLTHTQAQQIASYVRALPVAVTGRPWNPPYQPGPGLDKKPLAAWAAGAGLGAVLSKDEEMLPYLFPHGITYNPSDKAYNPSDKAYNPSDKDGIGAQDTLNMRELPVALQLPDWNHWLPRIHPKDAWGDTFTQSAFAQFYDGQGPSRAGGTNLRAILGNPDPGYHAFITSNAGAQLPSLLNSWSGGDYGDFISRRQAQNDGSALYQEKMESSAKWMLVKNWELMQEYHLEGNAPAIFPTQANAPTAGESRAWVSEAAFLVSPAFVSVPENGVAHSRVEFEYLTNAWYYTQMVLNAGNRHRDGWHPVDWGYAIGRTGDLAAASGQPGLLRTTAMLIKAMQQSDTNGSMDTTHGWFPHFVGDMRFFHWMHGSPDGADQFSPSPAKNAAIYAQIATAVARAQFDKMQRYTPAQYRKSAQGGESSVMYGGDSLFNMQKESLTDLAGVGVDKDLLRREAAWDKTVWPDFPWDTLKP